MPFVVGGERGFGGREIGDVRIEGRQSVLVLGKKRTDLPGLSRESKSGTPCACPQNSFLPKKCESCDRAKSAAVGPYL